MPAKQISAREFKLKPFLAWLAEQPVIIERPCGDFELARYMLGRERFIIWDKPSKGRISFGHEASYAHWLSFCQGGIIAPVTVDIVAKPKPIKGEHLQIYCDASHIHRSGAGAWAAVLIEPDKSMREISGPLKGDVASSTAAETCAMANALHRFLATGAIKPNSAVVFVCDNKAAVDYINRGKCRAKGISGPQIRTAYAYLAGLARRANLKLSARWVKGHQRENLANQDITMNRLADKLAAKHSAKLHAERVALAATQRLASSEGDMACCP